MTVYIEYVLIDNFIIDYCLFRATFFITRTQTKRVRIVLCSLLGAAIALLYPLISVNNAVMTILKVLCGLFLVLLCGDFSSVKRYAVNCAVFFALTFLTGGVINGVMNIMGVKTSGEVFISLVFVPAALVIKAVVTGYRKVFMRRSIISNSVRTELAVNGKTVTVSGFIDTGNCVYDGDSPVIICGATTMRKVLKKTADVRAVKLVNVSTVVGKGKRPAVKLDCVKIYYDGQVHINNNATLCVASAWNGVYYDVILHPALLGDAYAFGDDFKTEKIS